MHACVYFTGTPVHSMLNTKSANNSSTLDHITCGMCVCGVTAHTDMYVHTRATAAYRLTCETE